jgi:hypothetical protein
MRLHHHHLFLSSSFNQTSPLSKFLANPSGAGPVKSSDCAADQIKLTDAPTNPYLHSHHPRPRRRPRTPPISRLSSSVHHHRQSWGVPSVFIMSPVSKTAPQIYLLSLNDAGGPDVAGSGYINLPAPRTPYSLRIAIEGTSSICREGSLWINIPEEGAPFERTKFREFKLVSHPSGITPRS